jgi:hypothetical protein
MIGDCSGSKNTLAVTKSSKMSGRLLALSLAGKKAGKLVILKEFGVPTYGKSWKIALLPIIIHP